MSGILTGGGGSGTAINDYIVSTTTTFSSQKIQALQGSYVQNFGPATLSALTVVPGSTNLSSLNVTPGGIVVGPPGINSEGDVKIQSTGDLYLENGATITGAADIPIATTVGSKVLFVNNAAEIATINSTGLLIDPASLLQTPIVQASGGPGGELSIRDGAGAESLRITGDGITVPNSRRIITTLIEHPTAFTINVGNDDPITCTVGNTTYAANQHDFNGQVNIVTGLAVISPAPLETALIQAPAGGSISLRDNAGSESVSITTNGATVPAGKSLTCGKVTNPTQVKLSVNATDRITCADAGGISTYTGTQHNFVGQADFANGLTIYGTPIELGLKMRGTCRAATTANIALTGLQTVDGVAVAAADRVLVKNQTSTPANGIYTAAAGAWTRATDFDETIVTEVVQGCFTLILEGTVGAGSGWIQSLVVTTIGVDPIVFSQFSTSNIVGYMDLASNQSATGIKTFSNASGVRTNRVATQPGGTVYAESDGAATVATGSTSVTLNGGTGQIIVQSGSVYSNATSQILAVNGVTQLTISSGNVVTGTGVETRLADSQLRTRVGSNGSNARAELEFNSVFAKGLVVCPAGIEFGTTGNLGGTIMLGLNPGTAEMNGPSTLVLLPAITGGFRIQTGTGGGPNSTGLYGRSSTHYTMVGTSYDFRSEVGAAVWAEVGFRGATPRVYLGLQPRVEDTTTTTELASTDRVLVRQTNGDVVSYKPVLVSEFRRPSQAISADVVTDVTWNAATSDDQSLILTGGTVFTNLRPGEYSISATVGFTPASSGGRRLWIDLNAGATTFGAVAALGMSSTDLSGGVAQALTVTATVKITQISDAVKVVAVTSNAAASPLVDYAGAGVNQPRIVFTRLS